MVQDRRLFCVLIVVGLLCGLVWGLAKIPWAGRVLTASDAAFQGDLYEECPVRDFLSTFPEDAEGPVYAPIADAEILFLGDSFSTVRHGHQDMPALLAEATGRSLFHHRMTHGDPLRYLAENPEATPQVVVLECAERFLGERYRKRRPVSGAPGVPSRLRTTLYQLKKHVFTNNGRQVEFLVTRNPLARRWREVVASARFAAWGELCDPDALYQSDPPVLFLPATTDASSKSYYSPHSDDLVEAIAATVASFSRDLEARGVALIFVPVPNKISIYGQAVAGSPYDRFLPRVVERLRSKGVVVVDLLPLYKALLEEGRVPYHPTDSHWNALGASVAADAVARSLEPIANRL